MAIKASDQLSLVDLTDGYSVVLTNESHTFPGDDSGAIASSVNSTVIALRGATQVAPNVDPTQIVKSRPNDIQVVVADNGRGTASGGLAITFAIVAGAAAGGTVDIPVAVDSVTIHKIFTYEIARSGADGAPGAPGADAITISIESSDGTIFKNTAIATTLTAHVYKAGAEVTGASLAALGTIKWYKDGTYMTGRDGQTLTISVGDVNNKATFMAQLEA